MEIFYNNKNKTSVQTSESRKQKFLKVFASQSIRIALGILEIDTT
jgi:hypothetical protein